MSLKDQQELETTYMMTTYGRKPVSFLSGKGMSLYDSEGNEYLDFLAGVGCVCLGHSNIAVADAIATQAYWLVQVSNYYYSEHRGEFARDLSDLLNTKNEGSAPWKTFFANSGAEANEGAIKLALKYGKLYLNGAGTIISAKKSFHGRTMITTAATGQAVKQEAFAPMPPGFIHVNPDNLDDLANSLEAASKQAEEQHSPKLAPVAVLLECTQGEGGVVPLDEDYLKGVRALTEEQGLLLIIDEVQTGYFRTGLPFSFMHAGIVPDVVTMAKGIANGFPCGAFSARGKAADILEPGEHGSTFGGNPLAIAAARATLAELKERDIGVHVEAVGAYFKDKLAELPLVTEVRGKGLMLGVSLEKPCAIEAVDKALERGFVINSIGTDILRFLPPLIVRESEIDELILTLQGILGDL